MSESEGKVQIRQNVLEAYGEYQCVAPAAIKPGFLVEATKWDLFALQGRMFTAKQTTIGTALTGSAADAAAIVLTAPTFRFTVPTGTTVFVRRLNVSFAAMAGTVNEFALIYTSADSYTSGGTAIAPLNWRTDSAARATAVTNCYHASGSAIVEAALTGVRALYQDVRPAAFTAGETFYSINQEFNDLHPIVGPASVLLYLSAVTTANTHYLTLDWAEVPTVSVIQA